jgi:hypothetical protein
MEPKHVQGDKDDLARIRDNQQNYEKSVPEWLSFLYDPFCALREQVSAIRQKAEDGRGHGAGSNGQKYPCAPPMQLAGWQKEQQSKKRDVKHDTSNDFGNGHRVLRK